MEVTMVVLTTLNPGQEFKPIDMVIAHSVDGLNVVKYLTAMIFDISGGRLRN